MRTAIIPLMMSLVGCSSSPALELLEALSAGDRTQLRTGLAADVRLATSASTIIGQEPVHAALSALPNGGDASGHHDVALLVLPDVVLFAMGTESVQSIALFEGEGSNELPKVIDDYMASWNEPDAARRDALLGGFAVDGRYVDPTIETVSREALAAHLTSFRASMPGTLFERTSHVRRAGDWYLFDWTMTSGGTTTPGTDAVHLDGNGRVVLVAGFF
jgi:hypothetical protein